MDFFPFIMDRLPQLGLRAWEHIVLTGVSVLGAIAFGIPLGILTTRNTAVKKIIFTAAGIVQTIPSLALLAFLLPFLGIGIKPAIAALVLYALLPIVRNTYTGITEIDPSILEAASGLGFSSKQKLWLVEFPLAIPVIIAGIRTSTVICVGIATLSAFIGAGGLGDFIIRGLSMNHTQLILLGAVPAALMAIVLDMFIGWIEKRISWRRHHGG